MNAIDFIGNSFRTDFLQEHIKPCNTICAFTGKEIKEGVAIKKAIADTFTDQHYIRFNSEYISVNAAKCIMGVFPSNGDRLNALRAYSFIATQNNLRILKQNELQELMYNLPQEPFALCVTYSNKKHIAFKAHVNFDDADFYIDTDVQSFIANRVELLNLLNIARRWYSVIPAKAEKAEKPTWFTKAEISGESYVDSRKAADYCRTFGEDVFNFELETLRKHINTPLIKFIAFIVLKNV